MRSINLTLTSERFQCEQTDRRAPRSPNRGLYSSTCFGFWADPSLFVAPEWWLIVATQKRLRTRYLNRWPRWRSGLQKGNAFKHHKLNKTSCRPLPACDPMAKSEASFPPSEVSPRKDAESYKPKLQILMASVRRVWDSARVTKRMSIWMFFFHWCSHRVPKLLLNWEQLDKYFHVKRVNSA